MKSLPLHLAKPKESPTVKEVLIFFPESNMAWLNSPPSSRKAWSFHTQRLFIVITTGQETPWPGPVQCPGKTLDMIEKAETRHNIPTTRSA